MKPGKYVALKPLCLVLCRSNGDYAPSTIERSEIGEGEAFEIPEMVNDFYYVVQIWEYDENYPYLVDAVKGVDYEDWSRG